MVSDGDEVYRVVVVRKKQELNPDYNRETALTVPYFLYSETETVKSEYGPYNTVGIARSIRTREVTDYRGDPRHDVADAWIEQAETVWKRTDL